MWMKGAQRFGGSFQLAMLEGWNTVRARMLGRAFVGVVVASRDGLKIREELAA